MFEFVWPWLFALLPVPWLLARALPPATLAGAIRLPYSGVESAEARTARGHSLLALLLWACLLAAAARPQWLGDPVALPAQGRDLVLAIDLSGSMDERDIAYRGRSAQRLAVVQSVAGDFIDNRRGDRIGLVLFGERAYLQSPLSLDRPTTAQLLDEAEVGLAGQKTAIGDAIGLGVKHLRDAGATGDKVLILLTDGESNAGSLEPRKAAELAAQAGVRIHTIGFGSDQSARLGFFTTTRAGIDTRTLKDVADTTGGRFFEAQSVGTLKQVYDLINQIEPVNVDELSLRPVTSLLHWPLGLALALSLALALRNRQGAA